MRCQLKLVGMPNAILEPENHPNTADLWMIELVAHIALHFFTNSFYQRYEQVVKIMKFVPHPNIVNIICNFIYVLLLNLYKIQRLQKHNMIHVCLRNILLKGLLHSSSVLLWRLQAFATKPPIQQCVITERHQIYRISIALEKARGRWFLKTLFYLKGNWKKFKRNSNKAILKSWNCFQLE